MLEARAAEVEAARALTTFDDRFLEFYKGLCDKYTEITYTFEATRSQLIRILMNHGSESVYCFIDPATGNILFPATYSSPTKSNPIRGNIYENDCYRCCNKYGISSLR